MGTKVHILQHNRLDAYSFFQRNFESKLKTSTLCLRAQCKF